jgi:superfamily II RNA helicase
MVLNLLLSHSPEEIEELLARSFATYQNLEDHQGLVKEMEQLQKDINAELEGTECGDLDAVLRTLSRKRELEQQLKEAHRELRRSREPLYKKAYLTPGRLFRNKKREIFVTLNQETRNHRDGVTAIRVWPRPRLRRGKLRKRWLRFEKIVSVLDGSIDLATFDSPPLWLESLLSTPLDSYPPLEVKDPLPSPESEIWDNLKAKVENLQTEIATLPCGKCPHFSKCEPKKRSRFKEKINKALALRHRLDDMSNRLWHEFNRHFRFLQQEGYLDETGRLSEDGVWASQLRLDQPLMIAESIRLDVFPHDDLKMLAGLIAPFVSDRDSHTDTFERLNLLHPTLGKAFARMVSALHPLRRRLRQEGFLVNPLPFWPAAAIYSWISGATWEELGEISGLDEGDLAMLIYRTADSLRQLEGLTRSHPRLAASATKAIQRLLREPVEVPT